MGYKNFIVFKILIENGKKPLEGLEPSTLSLQN